MVERLVYTEDVVGSSPAPPTKKIMVIREFTILNEDGLHARPAAVFVKVAGQFKSDVSVTNNEVSVDGKSIIGLLTLGAGYGSKITVKASGSDESKMIRAIQEIIKNKFK